MTRKKSGYRSYGKPAQWQDALGPDLTQELIAWAHAQPLVPRQKRRPNGQGKSHHKLSRKP